MAKKTAQKNNFSTGNNITSSNLASDSQSPDNLQSLTHLSKIISKLENGFIWSLTFNDNEEVVFYSDNIEKVTGFRKEEIKQFPGRGSSLIFSQDLPLVKEQMQEFANDPDKSLISLVYRIKCKNKKIIWIKEDIRTDRNPKGSITSLWGLVIDITELKKNEEKLKNKIEYLSSLNTSKDKFISMLSHDLRAPFTSILGFSEILMNEPNLSKEERIEYLSYINDSSQNQLQLVNYLLDWSRLQTGRLVIELQKLHAQSIVFNCVSSLTGNAIRKNISINVDIPENLYIMADERMLTQVVTNLLSNAIKFSPENKTIDMSVSSFNNNMVEFVTKDQGIGISESNKSKLFKIEEMFSTHGTKGEKGTGLGLSLVKEIIEKHNGKIWFYSELGKGSEFHFTVPISPNTILITETDDEFKRIYESSVRENFSNYEILWAKNGYEAMNLIFEHVPSLVITDHDMPLMNGIQLIEAIRKEDKNLRVPILPIISNLPSKLRQAYLEAGIPHILTKPINETDFTTAVKKILN